VQRAHLKRWCKAHTWALKWLSCFSAELGKKAYYNNDWSGFAAAHNRCLPAHALPTKSSPGSCSTDKVQGHTVSSGHGADTLAAATNINGARRVALM